MDTRQLACLLRGGRAEELLPGGGAARRHAARRQPAGALAREAARPQLLDRSGRRVEPTEAGLALYRARAADARSSRSSSLDELARPARAASSAARSTIGASTGPGGTVVPVAALRVPARSTPASRVALSISDTQSGRRAGRRARARARRRRRRAAPPRRRRSSRSSATRSCSPCPPGHRFAGRTVTLDELREEPLIVMQEGAGVRQVIEDELRSAGHAPARPRRRGSSSACRSPCAGGGRRRLRRHVHLARGDRGRPRRRHARRRRASTGSTRRARSRSSAPPAASPTRAAAGVRRVRARAARVIVRWGLDELERLLAELGIERAARSSRASAGTA